MTREEAKDLALNLEVLTKPAYFNFIDNIYDDFESRVCKNCKYNYGCSIQDSLLQTAEQNKLYIYNLDNFGCNKFYPLKFIDNRV